MACQTLKKNAVNLAVFAGWLIAASETLVAASQTNQLDIQRVSVNDRSIPLNGRTVNLGAFPQHVTFLFPPGSNAAPPVRVRFKLESFDSKWHDAPDAMTLTVRFFSASGDQVSQNIFNVNGESAGWNGSLRTSTLTHRREDLIVPPQAARFMAVISSAGPAASIGVYVVADLAISKVGSNAAPVLLLASPSDQELEGATNGGLSGWMRDGLHKSMAGIVTIGEGTGRKALAILDDDRSSHAEWRVLFERSPQVTPGEHLLVEWNEMYSIGDGNVTAAHYDNLPEGNYIFHVAESDIFGRPTGVECHINVIVPPPFWRTAWFWTVTSLSVLATVLAISRYVSWHKVRREMAYLRGQQALQRERLRIAQDIHDDLGARVTQISLLSAMAPTRATFPDQARDDFDKIFRMSRGLISALYETVWAVNPEKDNLEALGSYLVQQINELVKSTGLRCRLNVQDLPAEVHVSSQVRHNIYMSAKEAVHNVLKHANAAEVMVHVTYVENELAVSIRDDGCGLRSNNEATGNGLENMKRRMNDIGGTCRVERGPDRGTTVILCLALTSLNGEHAGKGILTHDRNGTARIIKT